VFKQLCVLLTIACCAPVALAEDYEKADREYGLQFRQMSAEDVKVKIEAEEKEIKSNKTDPEPHVRKALALSALAFRDPRNDKHWTAAIESYKEAVKLWKVIGKNKDDKRQGDADWRIARLHVYLGYAYIEVSKYEEAEKMFNEAAKNEKMTAMVKSGRDYLMMKKGK
jgi:tetratricopeptide (TPR) repeat protein